MWYTGWVLPVAHVQADSADSGGSERGGSDRNLVPAFASHFGGGTFHSGGGNSGSIGFAGPGGMVFERNPSGVHRGPGSRRDSGSSGGGSGGTATDGIRESR